MTNEWIMKKLKSIDQIVEENPGEWYVDRRWADFDSTSRDIKWHINDSMISKFGNEEEYYFKFIERKSDMDAKYYTHRGWDDYAYHESWFYNDKLDFNIEELFEI